MATSSFKLSPLTASLRSQKLGGYQKCLEEVKNSWSGVYKFIGVSKNSGRFQKCQRSFKNFPSFLQTTRNVLCVPKTV